MAIQGARCARNCWGEVGKYKTKARLSGTMCLLCCALIGPNLKKGSHLPILSRPAPSRLNYSRTSLGECERLVIYLDPSTLCSPSCRNCGWCMNSSERCLSMQYDTGSPTTCKIHVNPLGFQKNGFIYPLRDISTRYQGPYNSPFAECLG